MEEGGTGGALFHWILSSILGLKAAHVVAVVLVGKIANTDWRKPITVPARKSPLPEETSGGPSATLNFCSEMSSKRRWADPLHGTISLPSKLSALHPPSYATGTVQ